MSERVTSAYAIRDATVKLGWFTRAELFLVGYDSGRFAVVYLERVEDSEIPVELADTFWVKGLPSEAERIEAQG